MTTPSLILQHQWQHPTTQLVNNTATARNTKESSNINTNELPTVDKPISLDDEI